MSREGIYDIHCHIVPGVDDGSANYEETKKLLRMEYDQGVRNIIATPHFRFRMFETPLSKVREQIKLVQQAVAEIGDDFNIYLGCEFHANMEMVETLDRDFRPTLADSRYVLTEFSSSSTRAFIKERADALLTAGYYPIIAHIERYRALRKDFDFIADLIEMGCEMQVNADAVIGRNGLGAQRFCKKLMQEDMLHYVASDAHNLRGRASHMEECCEYLKKHMGRLYTSRIMRDNPSKIVET